MEDVCEMHYKIDLGNKKKIMQNSLHLPDVNAAFCANRRDNGLIGRVYSLLDITTVSLTNSFGVSTLEAPYFN